jgi:hypothetical protein
MFNRFLITLINQKEEYSKLQNEVVQTLPEKSIENILEIIKQDIEKITRLNQIKYLS